MLTTASTRLDRHENKAACGDSPDCLMTRAASKVLSRKAVVSMRTRRGVEQTEGGRMLRTERLARLYGKHAAGMLAVGLSIHP